MSRRTFKWRRVVLLIGAILFCAWAWREIAGVAFDALAAVSAAKP